MSILNNLHVDNLQDFDFSKEMTRPQTGSSSKPKVQEIPAKEEALDSQKEIVETMLSLKEDLQLLQEQAAETPDDELRGTLRIVSGQVGQLKKTLKRGKLSEAFNPLEEGHVPKVAGVPTTSEVGPSTSKDIKQLLENELLSMKRGVKMNKKRNYTTIEIVRKMNRSQKDMLLTLIIANQGVNLSELGFK